MTEIASLKIKVDAVEAKAAADAMNKMAPAASKAQKAVGGVASASGALNKVLGVTAGLLSAREILQAAESWTTLNNRLRLVTESTESFNSAQGDIFRIAQETRQGLTATAELYQRIAANQKELGLNGKETAGIVQTINQALVVSGTAGAGAQAALIQLGQAFASGTLRGEELNAVLEQAPALAQAIAAGMGVTVGKLRALGAEGVLTADAVVKSLQNQAEAVEEKFSTMAPTVSGALTQLDNSFIQLVGRMDESTGASANASEAISKLAAVLSDPSTIAAANNLAAGLATAFTAIIEAARDVVGGVQWMAEEVAVALGGIGGHDIDRLEEEATRLQNLLGKMQVRGETGYAMYGSVVKDLDEVNAKIETYYQLQSEAPKAPVAKTLPQAPVLKETSAQIELVTKKAEGLTDAQRAMAKAADELASAQRANSDVIGDLAEQLYQATLGADELLKRQNELRLNEYATPEQVAQVRSMTDALSKLKAQEAANEELDRRRKEFGSNPAATVRGEVPPLTGGRFDDQAARYEAERQAEAIRYQEQQARLTEALDLEVIAKQEAWMLEEQFYQEHTDRLNQIDQARTDMMMENAARGFSQMSNDIMAFAQVFAAENKEMFEVAKAAAIASTIIETYTAAQRAFSSMAAIPVVGPALGAVAAGAAVMGGMARVAQIRSQTPSFDGGGFTGTGSRSGGMDGKGGFMAMLHPNETVIDHTKGQQAPGSGAQVVNNFAISGQVDRRTQGQIAGKMALEQQRNRARFSA